MKKVKTVGVKAIRILSNLRKKGYQQLSPTYTQNKQIAEISNRPFPVSTFVGGFPFASGGFNDGNGYYLGKDGKPDKRYTGETFRSFVYQLKRHGYDVDHRELKACDYGAPTIRKRFFLIERCDGRAIMFPKPTHGTEKGLLPYRTAAECINAARFSGGKSPSRKTLCAALREDWIN